MALILRRVWSKLEIKEAVLTRCVWGGGTKLPAATCFGLCCWAGLWPVTRLGRDTDAAGGQFGNSRKVPSPLCSVLEFRLLMNVPRVAPMPPHLTDLFTCQVCPEEPQPQTEELMGIKKPRHRSSHSALLFVALLIHHRVCQNHYVFT